MSEVVQPKSYEIRCESDLFECISRFEAGEWDPSKALRFIDWPRYEIRIRGKDFDGGVPMRIMHALIILQREINRGYARYAYGKVRRLTEKEEKKTELITKFEPGSTAIISELAPVLNDFLSSLPTEKMTAHDVLILILGIATLLTSGWAWKVYLNARIKMHAIDALVKMHRIDPHDLLLSKQENEYAQIMAKLVNKYQFIADQHRDSETVKTSLLKKLHNTDELILNGKYIVNGAIARHIIQKPHTPRVTDLLDGNFIILSIHSGNVGGGLRAHIRNIESREKLWISIPSGTLPNDQIITASGQRMGEDTTLHANQCKTNWRSN